MITVCFIIMIIPLKVAVAQTPAPAPAPLISVPDVVGSGARAMGMGGAFIGVADDATAASWNPAGLIQVEKPEVSLVVNGFHRIEDNSFGSHPEACGGQSVTDGNINYASITCPFVLFDKNMNISLNYQRLYDFYGSPRELNFSIVTEGAFIRFKDDTNYQRDGSLSVLGVAYSTDLTSRLSMGFTLNIWRDLFNDNEWEENLNTYSIVRFPGGLYSSEYHQKAIYSLKTAFNFNFGLLWTKSRICHEEDLFQLGLVFKSPFLNRAELINETTGYLIEEASGGIIIEDNYSYIEVNKTLQIPVSYGIGIAYRSSDKDTIAVDIYRTHWEDYAITEPDGMEISPVTGKAKSESDIDSTCQIRIGYEHLFYDDNQKDENIFAFRLGAFYDPAPAEGSPDDFWGVTFGGGWITKWFSADLAVQYRWGNDVGSSILPEAYIFSQDIREWNAYASVIVYFGD